MSEINKKNIPPKYKVPLQGKMNKGGLIALILAGVVIVQIQLPIDKMSIVLLRILSVLQNRNGELW